MAKKVTVINAISESKHMQPQQSLKVCAYARVSTGSRAQENPMPHRWSVIRRK